MAYLNEKKLDPDRRLPPVTKVAPLLSASAMCSSTLAIPPSLIMAPKGQSSTFKLLIFELTLCCTIVCVTKLELCFNSDLDLGDEFVVDVFVDHDVICADACLSFSGVPRTPSPGRSKSVGVFQSHPGLYF